VRVGGQLRGGGSYKDGSGHTQGFVVSERNGTWGKAIELPGLGALNTDGAAGLSSVSCPSTGNCAAGGSYRISAGHFRSFVVSERNGRWGRAITVPGLAKLNSGTGNGSVSVSCASAGNCAAGGLYGGYDPDNGNTQEGFVASERNGVWGKAVQVPGLQTLNSGQGGGALSVSCTSAGNCAAGGDYLNDSGFQAFVASERHGVWAKATAVRGLGTLNADGDARVSSLSCTSAGNCAAGGYYQDAGNHFQGFVTAEVNGLWGQAIEVPGLGTLNTGGNAAVSSVSCTSGGSCAAGGFYRDGAAQRQGFVVTRS
jgi:hypothetical protein